MAEPAAKKPKNSVVFGLRPSHSDVWTKFKLGERDAAGGGKINFTMCRFCQAALRCNGGTMSNLHAHQSRHMRDQAGAAAKRNTTGFRKYKAQCVFCAVVE